MQLITSAAMQESSTTKGVYVLGRKYTAHDATVGEVEAIFVKAQNAVGVAGSPMYPVTASWNVAGEFLVDDDENGSGIVGQEFCVGSWLGGVTTVANTYGFIQTKGWNLVTITTDDSVEALDIVLPSSTDGTWLGSDRAELQTDATNTPFTRAGFAPEADGGTTMVLQKVMWDFRQNLV